MSGLTSAVMKQDNVLAALASFFIPGLGQLCQGRLLSALFWFVISSLLWWVLLGWLGHIGATYSAAVYRGKTSK